MQFSKLKISTRLACGFGGILLLMIIMVALGLRSMSHIKEDLDKIVDENVYKMDLLQTMSESVHIVSRVSRTVLLLQDKNQIETELKKSTMRAPSMTLPEKRWKRCPPVKKAWLSAPR